MSGCWVLIPCRSRCHKLCEPRSSAFSDLALTPCHHVQVAPQLKGLILSAVIMPQPWERVMQLDFAKRPSEAPVRHVYCEVMSKYVE